jgi:diaminopimelate dehydrogenase
LAVWGLGRLGRACAGQVLADPDLALAGVVRRPERVGEALGGELAEVARVAHFGDLRRVDAALVCLPPERTEGAVRELLQAGVPAVECARLPEAERAGYRDRLAGHAARYRTPAATEAGWDPGMLSVFRAQFAFLVPHGHTEETQRPGEALHHLAPVPEVPGVREAVGLRLPRADGAPQNYVYVELDPGADSAAVTERLRADPFWAGEEVLVFPVPSVAELEEAGHGVVLDRRGTAGGSAHQHLLLEARCSEADLAARVMVGAARAVAGREPGVYSALDLPVSGWGR